MKKGIKILFFIIAASLIFVGGWSAGAVYRNVQISNGKAVAKNFANSIFSSNFDKAYSLTTEEFKKNISREQFETSFSNTESKPVYVQEAVIEDGKTLTISFALNNLPKNDKGSTNGAFLITLKKESGNWRVASGVLN